MIGGTNLSNVTSIASSSLVPEPEKNLMPLSLAGLCEAVMTIPASARRLRVT